MNTSPSQNQQQQAKISSSIQGFKNLSKNQVQIELRQEYLPTSQKGKLEIDEYILNHKHSNSEGLPDIDRDNSNQLVNLSNKEKEHYTFLNNLKTKFNVDQSKLINLECRLSGHEKETISQHLALSSNLKNSSSRGNLNDCINDESYSRLSINSNSQNLNQTTTSFKSKRKSTQPQKHNSKIVHAMEIQNSSPKLQPKKPTSPVDITPFEPQIQKRVKSTHSNLHQSDSQQQLITTFIHDENNQNQSNMMQRPRVEQYQQEKDKAINNSQNIDQTSKMIQQIKDENDQLKRNLDNQMKLFRQKEEEHSKSNQLLNTFNQQIKEITSLYEQQEAQKKLYIESLVKTLTSLEDKLRKEKRIWLNEQAIRLGRLTTQRQSTKFIEVWEEGEAFKKLHIKLREIQREKEEIEKLKKNRNKVKSVKKSASVLPSVPTDGFSNISGSSMQRNMSNNGLNSIASLNENSEFDLEESEFNNIDKNEQKEIYQFKQRLLENEEKRVRDELQILDKEKCLYLNEFKRMRDEEFSKYCGINSKRKFEVLQKKYLILSLLGKGGYSEVYKAYDLEQCREVACKIHQFDDSWNETIKDSYIKHALRENEIHKDLNNRRVVKQFDTVEIDHNSFCTVLEQCTGPDLYFYLKQQRQIPEKEAKLIISQILSGLKYLNDQKQKIIHYDLKPQNILFHNGEVKITDFGLCKIMEENSDRIELTSQGVGTYWYQAPECFEVSNTPMITSKVDIWSVGVIFFELLYGQKPFGHDKSQQAILQDQTILKAKEVIFPSKPQVSDACKDFLRKCLSYYQYDRYDVYEAYYSPYLRGSNQQIPSQQQPANNMIKQYQK
ncbi:protein kinase domain containing protein [Stylonychia lemnae]|uniref:Protein kinase domain containing protein n=1 Tax=Stylonychia lemnae TaxID=5949 RepID=A0A077ZXC9_STYLE|nr:protein kinase domain containing protein [Stylonychia lemnae]|eukprot:CDW74566.1 protein kinase domain containing protein [Stylonychia lemnae]